MRLTYAASLGLCLIGLLGYAGCRFMKPHDLSDGTEERAIIGDDSGEAMNDSRTSANNAERSDGMIFFERTIQENGKWRVKVWALGEGQKDRLIKWLKENAVPDDKFNDLAIMPSAKLVIVEDEVRRTVDIFFNHKGTYEKDKEERIDSLLDSLNKSSSARSEIPKTKEQTYECWRLK